MITLVPVGGLANRMRAIDSAIALAEDTNHELQIIWFKDKGLNCKFHDLFQSFQLPGVSIKEADSLDLLLNDRPRKKNLHLPSIFLSIQYDDKLYEKDVTDLFYLQFDFKQWVLNHKNVWIASYIYFYPIKATKRRYHIFQPTLELEAEINKRCAQWNKPTIGVHIRRTDNIDSIQQSPTELFIRHMEQALVQNPDTSFYLATDSEKEKELLIAHFGERIQTSPYPASRNTKEGVQEGLVELYTLSRTKQIFGSSNSSYTDAAAIIGNIGIHIVLDNTPKTESIHIALATDNNYIVPTTVALQSIFNHHTDIPINIYLCFIENHLKKDFLDFFAQQTIKHHSTFHPLMISKEQLADLPDTRHGKATLLRLCLPELLPHLDKILYLDGDIIVNDSLKELYNTPLGENYIAAAKDPLPIYHPDYIEKLNISKEHGYFNAGVSLLNLHAMRKMNSIKQIGSFAQKNFHLITLPDQDALNYLCQGHTCFIHPRYNMNYLVEKDVAEQTWGKKQLKEAQCTPAIIHYVGPIKPWSVLCVHPQRELWWKTLRDTPFKNFKPKDACFQNYLRKAYLWVFKQTESIFTLENKRKLGKIIPSGFKRAIKKSAMKPVNK